MSEVDERAWRKPAGLALLWVVAAVLAVTVGVLAVTTVGASLRGRGPLGSEVVLDPDGTISSSTGPTPTLDPSGPQAVRTIREEFGEFDVGCQGYYAVGLDVRPATADGWRVVSYEKGPDDDVDAVFANQGRSIEIEVYCNRGEPTVAELERNTLPDED